MHLPADSLDKLYAKSRGRAINMEKTFLEEDVLMDDEIELQVKGLGGSRRHNWRLEEGLASILTR